MSFHKNCLLPCDGCGKEGLDQVWVGPADGPEVLGFCLECLPKCCPDAMVEMRVVYESESGYWQVWDGDELIGGFPEKEEAEEYAAYWAAQYHG